MSFIFLQAVSVCGMVGDWEEAGDKLASVRNHSELASLLRQEGWVLRPVKVEGEGTLLCFLSSLCHGFINLLIWYMQGILVLLYLICLICDKHRARPRIYADKYGMVCVLNQLETL